jgi:hypothetical protein
VIWWGEAFMFLFIKNQLGKILGKNLWERFIVLIGNVFGGIFSKW